MMSHVGGEGISGACIDGSKGRGKKMGGSRKRGGGGRLMPLMEGCDPRRRVVNAAGTLTRNKHLAKAQDKRYGKGKGWGQRSLSRRKSD
jgi:hypothetical protein